MTEVTPAVPATPPAETPPAPWSEKYKDQAAFEHGFSEIAKKLGVPFGRPILGESGVYDTPEAAFAGYKVFETALGKRSQPPPTPPKPPDPPAAPPAGSPPAELKIPEAPVSIESIDDIIASAGLDVKVISENFAKTGKLDDAAYAAFAAKGFGRAVVDQFIEGQQAIKARVEMAQAQAVQAAGGQEQVNALLKWAVTGVKPGEHADFNRRLKDPALMPGALQDLKLRYAAASGTSGSNPLVTGQPPSGKAGPKTHGEYMKWVDEANRGQRPWSDLKGVNLASLEQ